MTRSDCIGHEGIFRDIPWNRQLYFCTMQRSLREEAQLW